MRPTPTQVVGVENFTAIDAGVDHTCGATTDGKVYCWGNGANGRLGIGYNDAVHLPTEVVGLSSIAYLDAPPATDIGGFDSRVEIRWMRFEERISLAVLGTRRITQSNLI